jgi:hypothetical protein
MDRFSERIGVNPRRIIVQKDNIDEPLENGLWNGLMIFFWDRISYEWNIATPDSVSGLIYKIWVSHFKKRVDELPREDRFLEFIKDHFFRCEWYEIYDLIEFIIYNYQQDFQERPIEEFINYCNRVLERELSGYRVIGKRIMPITSEDEVSSIQSALEIDDHYGPVKIHLSASADFLSNRKNPNFRNSIKESISAVESCCCVITKNPKATLGMALNEIERKHKLHSALKNSFSSLYGYTSDAEGIRHALLSEDNLTQDDAIYMLVACSSFINYLIKKVSLES